MSQIRVIYEKEPNFPATDQHPDAVRYFVGNKVIDAIGGEPTQTEIDAILSPSPAPKALTVDELASQLVSKGILTAADVVAAITVEKAIP